MQVQKISNNNTNYNAQFKGTLSKSVNDYITEKIRCECYSYVHSLESDALIDKKVLNGIKAKWNEILDILRNKASLMHKDTTISVSRDVQHYGSSLNGITEEKKYLRAENSKFQKGLWFKLLYCDGNLPSSKYRSIKPEELKEYAENINPQEIDKDILGIEKESILNESQKFFYPDKDIKSRLSAVKEFQQEIGEPEDKEFIEMVNKNRAQIMAEKNTREQQRAVEQRKNDILDKFFDENL